MGYLFFTCAFVDKSDKEGAGDDQNTRADGDGKDRGEVVVLFGMAIKGRP